MRRGNNNGLFNQSNNLGLGVNQNQFLANQQSNGVNLEEIGNWISNNADKLLLGGLALYGTSKLLSAEKDETLHDLQFYIWDVKRGDCILVKGPEENVLIDVGGNSEFSPSEHINNKHGTDIDFTIISHPDEDHIEDLPNFVDEFSGYAYRRPISSIPYIKHRKNNRYPDKESYQEIAGTFSDNFDADSYEDSSDLITSERQEGPVRYKSYRLSRDKLGLTPVDELDDDQGINLNSLSYLTVVEYNGFQLVTMGDLEEEAIETLLEYDEVTSDIQGTDVLIAPHHGLDSSYTSELFNHFTPDIVAISDAGSAESSAQGKYTQQADGKTVARRNDSAETRYTVSTYNDGVIYIGVGESGSYKVNID